MRIVVNHVTRMSAPRICVAGIDPDTIEHVRPTTPPSDPITRALLREEGGPFGMGAVVELGNARAIPTTPEAEDHRFQTAHARRVGDMDGDDFLKLLDEACAGDLASAFGPALERIKWKYAVERGAGNRSLAVIRVEQRLKIEVDDRYGRLQVRFDDVEPPAYIPVTDIRFYESDQTTIRTRVVENVRARLRRDVTAFLMLGLARAYRASGDDRERHWLQVNGICLADRPTGDLP
jgi:putative nucleic acid modification protein with dual OB domain